MALLRRKRKLTPAAAAAKLRNDFGVRSRRGELSVLFICLFGRQAHPPQLPV